MRDWVDVDSWSWAPAGKVGSSAVVLGGGDDAIVSGELCWVGKVNLDSGGLRDVVSVQGCE